jgi:hypothetical protein
MSRTYLTFGDIAGKLHKLRIECTRCARRRQYSVAKLIAQHGHRGNMSKWMSDLRGDCPKRNAPQLHERCDLICPDLPKVLGGFHFAQVAAPVHVHLGPSCTQSHCTRPILFNPRIMQRLMTFSMDCVHASPRSLADAIAVVACPS